MDNLQAGTNLKQIRRQNLALVLRHVATGSAVNRADIARATGLSKMTVSNLVSELLEKDILREEASPIGTALGRPPVILSVSPNAPKFCGMLVKRGLCQVVLADLQGHALLTKTYTYPEKMDAHTLIALLLQGFSEVCGGTKNTIAAVGIASIGPINTKTGTILNPADFYGISNLNIAKEMEGALGLPTFLTNDANAGALAETLYGLGKEFSSFAYIHIMNGIGAGLVLDGSVHDGDFGQSGEIGHTSINFEGPVCSCGNRGCLDLYANIETMRQTICEMRSMFPDSPLLTVTAPEWGDFVQAAHEGDDLALCALDRFSRYLCHAVTNLLGILDISTIVLGYTAPEGCQIIERLLEMHLAQSPLHSMCRITSLVHSSFAGDAPLIGAAALAADAFFRCKLDI